MKSVLRVANELKAHPLIQIDKFKIGKPITKALLASIEKDSKLTLPDDVKAAYQVANGVEVVWRLKPGADPELLTKIEKAYRAGTMWDFDGDSAIGSICLNPLESVILGSAEWVDPEDEENPQSDSVIDFAGKEYPRAKFRNMLKVFDPFDVVHNYADCMSFVTKLEGHPFAVMLLDDHCAATDMSRICDFNTYLEIVAETRFVASTRARLFKKYRGDKEPMVTAKSAKNHPLVALLFK